MTDLIDFQARDHARMALSNTETLDIRLSMFQAEIEARLKALETIARGLDLATLSENSRIALADLAKLEKQISDLGVPVSRMAMALAKLEERVKTLESFHHWATTQIIPMFGDRIRTLERLANPIEQSYPEDGTMSPQREETTWQGAPITSVNVEHLLKLRERESGERNKGVS